MPFLPLEVHLGDNLWAECREINSECLSLLWWMLVANVEIFLVLGQLLLASKALIGHLSTVFWVEKGWHGWREAFCPWGHCSRRCGTPRSRGAAWVRIRQDKSCHYGDDYNCLQFHEVRLQSASFIYLPRISFHVSSHAWLWYRVMLHTSELRACLLTGTLSRGWGEAVSSGRSACPWPLGPDAAPQYITPTESKRA